MLLNLYAGYYFCFFGQKCCVMSDIVGYHDCFVLHLDDPTPNGDFMVGYSFCIAQLLLRIISYRIRMYHEKRTEAVF